MSKPKGWPSDVPYLSSPFLDKDVKDQALTALRTTPLNDTSIPSLPASSTSLPSSLVRITPITDPSHPAYRQHGLFALRDLKPGTFILPYLGRTHTSQTTDPTSDYDLWLDREADLAVDAAKSGNEARFVNDYRGGVREKPNAEFGVGWSEKWGMLCVGFWVVKGNAGMVGGGKAKDKGKWEGIKKGEEICVSYGKGFWEKRAEEEGASDGRG
ncbi:SET domain-containing protein [Sarocladium implicatum]|nr:SET domain-containing protein [Sarocladium implicatum]